MRCYRWRIADNCGEDDALKCSMRHRGKLYRELDTDTQLSTATLYSPGFSRGKYQNRNFCIYNVSLDCAQEMVEVKPAVGTTTSLSDADTRRDYLSFHLHDQRIPLMELSGSAVGNPSAYSAIPASSFYAILWTNDNGVDQGRFEIKATCKDAGLGSGDSNVRLAPN